MLDSFYKENDLTQIYLSRKIYGLHSNKKKNDLESAYLEYLISLKEEYRINENEEIYSNGIILSAFKGTKINQDIFTLEDIGNTYKDNFNKIKNFI